jgi:hypothetical protein
MLLVMLIPLCGRSICAVCLARTSCSILIDYMTNVLEINQILSRFGAHLAHRDSENAGPAQDKKAPRGIIT